MVENDLLELLINFLLLPKDNIPLPLNSRIVKLRVLQDITDDIHRLPNILTEALRIINSLLPRSIRIQMSTEVLDLQLQRMLGTLIRALESHMLQEMSSTVRFISLRS